MCLWFQETAVFLVFGFVSAQFDFPSPARMRPRCVDALARFAVRVFKPAPSLKPRQKIKNPRRPSLHLFCQCSNEMIAMRGILPRFSIANGRGARRLRRFTIRKPAVQAIRLRRFGRGSGLKSARQAQFQDAPNAMDIALPCRNGAVRPGSSRMRAAQMATRMRRPLRLVASAHPAGQKFSLFSDRSDRLSLYQT